MNIITTRFGEIDVDESKVIHMRGSIIGFEHLKQFVYKKDEKSPSGGSNLSR